MARGLTLNFVFCLTMLVLPYFVQAKSAYAAEQPFPQMRFEAPDAPRQLLKDLRAASLLETARSKSSVKTDEIIAAAQADYLRLLSILYNAGYFGGSIEIKLDGREAARLTLITDQPVISINVVITPGPLFRFDQAEVTPMAPGSRPLAEFSSDQVATTAIIRDAANAGILSWREAGHAKARVSGQSITADHQLATIDASIAVEPGARATLGALTVVNNQRVRTERIHEIAGLATGAQYSPERITRIADRLRRTGAFRSVTVTEANEIAPDGTLDVEVSVVEAKPRRIGFGGTIASSEGLSVETYLMHRNLLGGAERLRFEAGVAGIGGDNTQKDYTFASRFTRPATFSPDTSLSFGLEYENLNETDFTSEDFSITAILDHTFTSTLEGSIGLGFSRKSVSDSFGNRDFRLATIPFSLALDKRNDRFDASDGVFARTEILPFVDLDASEAGTRAVLDIRDYRAFGADDNIVLAARLQFGSVFGRRLSNIPPDFLFFSGGGGTVRGQAYQSLGIDVGGEHTGGRSFLGQSLELRMPVTDRFGVVAFADAGYIGERPVPTDSNGAWQAGAGLGLRYNTSIGPIRFDLATPVKGGDDGDKLFFYIGLGQAF